MNERRPPVLERPVMREQFRKELRGRLMSEAAVVLAPRPSWFSFPAILRPAFAAAAILVLVLAGATSAAASSLPGDALYVVKRTSEDVQVALTFDDVTRMQLLARLADRRLEELAEIATQRPSSAPLVWQLPPAWQLLAWEQFGRWRSTPGATPVTMRPATARWTGNDCIFSCSRGVQAHSKPDCADRS